MRSSDTSDAGQSQPPIGEYALVGDTRSAALISRMGSIDWLCLPRFDGDPVFGYLVDAVRGGRFQLAIDGHVERRAYRADSAVLETHWRGPNGTATITEAMPVDVRGFRPQLVLIRQVMCSSGEADVRVLFDPKFGLPGRPPRSSRRGSALVCEWGSLAVVLQCFGGEPPDPGRSEVKRLRQGSRLTLLLSLADRTAAVMLAEEEALKLIEETDRNWRRWSAEIEYGGPFRPALIRSLIVLRQLTYSPSGAPVAAPTTSLPERVGGDLNWDYRYAWPRDAGIGSGAFMAAGRVQEAQAFLRWLEVASRLTLPRMNVLYTLDGTPGHREREDWDLSGYRHSPPVRFANAAATQHQLDVYGWVVDTGWHLASLGSELDGPSWRMIRSLADFVARSWRKPDAGIWEERGDLRHYVSSKLLAYVALDRALRIAHRRGEKRKQETVWERERASLKLQLRERGWNEHLQSYTAAYGSDDLDASLLLLGMSEIEDESQRLRGTIAAVRERLSAGGVLLYRNLPNGKREANEGAFLPCTFWLIDALARAGQVDDAEALMAGAIHLGGELGLLAEEVDPSTGDMLGNYPQALSHSTLVSAALSIEEAKASKTRQESPRTPHAPAR